MAQGGSDFELWIASAVTGYLATEIKSNLFSEDPVMKGQRAKRRILSFFLGFLLPSFLSILCFGKCLRNVFILFCITELNSSIS